MDWQQLRALPPLTTLGAHTGTPRDLSTLLGEECLSELDESRTEMEQCRGRAAQEFDYPCDNREAGIRALVEGRFALACKTPLAFADSRSYPVFLPRIDAYNLQGTFHPSKLLTVPRRAYLAFRATA